VLPRHGSLGRCHGAGGARPSYWALVPVALLAGLGNSVFHPADYSIFNASVSPSRLGRAYGVHSIGGALGWAVAPAVIVTLSSMMGWRLALVTVGVLGVAAAVALSTRGEALDDRRETVGLRGAPSSGWSANVRLLMATPILVAFAYFALLATSLIGIQTFSVSAMVAIYEAPLGLATGALTAFLLGSAGGVLVGGFLADRTSRHDVVAGGGMLLGAVASLVIASAAPPLALLPVVMALAGFCLGATSPSRDMLVRAATPPHASGKVYGFVYSGLDLGSSLTAAPLRLAARPRRAAYGLRGLGRLHVADHRHRDPGPSPRCRRPIRAQLLRWRPRPHAQRTGVRLACGLRAPPRIWTLLNRLRVSGAALQLGPYRRPARRRGRRSSRSPAAVSRTPRPPAARRGSPGRDRSRAPSARPFAGRSPRPPRSRPC